MRWMNSGRDFVMLCAQQDTPWFLAAHVAAFSHFGGVVAAVTYDNLTAAVGKVLVGAPRVPRPRFAALAAHYAFEPRFCRPGVGHDKGGVERRGGHIRWQHLVPLPQGGSLAETSTALQRRIDAQHDRDASRADAWARERAALRALPLPFDGRHVRAVSSVTTPPRPSPAASTPSRADRADRPSTCSWGSTSSPSHSATRPYPIGALRLAIVVLTIAILLLPLSRKPQALRQVASELVAQFGDPWPALWKRFAPCTHPMKSRPPGASPRGWNGRTEKASGGRSHGPSTWPSPTARSSPPRAIRPARMRRRTSPRPFRSIPSKRPT